MARSGLLPSPIADQSGKETLGRQDPIAENPACQSAGIPKTIAELIAIARKAKQNNELHLALVTGVPGSGKTLVGIQLVYENELDDSEIRNTAVFTLGNGPLVKVLQHALKNKFYVQAVHGFLKEYGGSKIEAAP